MVGSTIGKYHVLDRIGRGGMGTVYRAMDETLHREVAIKVLNAELNDPEVAKRFRAEAVTVARLSHPGIATIYELFQHDGQWMMVMEYVRGETLEHCVERMGALSPQRAAELCMQALTALAHAHSMGVIHRDLKPANLMITESGAVKVMDFGIARVSGSEHLTSAGFMMGTPAYMAPEQVLGHEIDARADLYALGVVFYRLTTAKLPFKGDTPFAMAQSQVSAPPTPLGMQRSDLPTWADQIVTRALAKAPDERFQSAVEFYEAFSRCLAGLPMTAPYSSSAPTEMLHTPSRPMPTAATPLQGAVGPTTGGLPVGGPTLPPAYGGETASRVAASGRTFRGPLPVLAPAPAAKKITPTAWVLAAAVVVLGVVLVALWIRMHRQTSAPPAATTEAVATPTPTTAVPEPPVAVDASAAGGTPQPTATPPATAQPTTAVPPPPTAASPAPPPTSPGPPKPDLGPRGATGAASPTPTPGRADARSGGARSTAATPGGQPAAPEAAESRGRSTATVPEEHLAFPNVKLLSVIGKRGQDQDVLMSFVGGQISVTVKNGGSAILSLPYKDVVHGTYTHAKDPKWDTALPGPPDKIDMPGFLIRTARHWLTLQTKTSYVIFRLEDDNWERIVQTVEARTSIKIERIAEK
jgi:serine/threonine-protein kinase